MDALVIPHYRNCGLTMVGYVSRQNVTGTATSFIARLVNVREAMLDSPFGSVQTVGGPVKVTKSKPFITSTEGVKADF